MFIVSYLIKTTLLRYNLFCSYVYLGLAKNVDSISMPMPMLKVKRLFMVLLCFLSMHSSLVMAAKLSPLLSRIGTEEGLVQGSIEDILQDDDGFIWLATKGGLDRYDGYAIKHIKGPNNIFVDAYIRHIYQDSLGIFWIGTRYQGLYRYDTKKNTVRHFFTSKAQLERRSVNAVTDIVEDDQHNLWIASKREIRVYNRVEQKMHAIFNSRTIAKKPPSIRRILLQGDLLYIATTQGLYVLDTKTGSRRKIEFIDKKGHLTTTLNCKELYFDDQQTLWIGTTKGLYSFDNSRISELNNKSVKLAVASIRLKKRNIWRLLAVGSEFYLATNDGLYRFDPANNNAEFLWRFQDSSFALLDNNIRSMIQDNHGNFWLGSKLNGVYLWNPKTTLFHSLSQQSDIRLSHNKVYSVAQASDHSMWLGTKNGLNRVDINTGDVQSLFVSENNISSRTSGTIYEIKPRKNGTFWLATGTKMVNFDPLSQQVLPIKAATAADRKKLSLRSWDYVQDDKGRLWYKTRHSYYRYDPSSGKVEPLTQLTKLFPPELSSSFIGFLAHKQAILFAVNNQLWLINTESKQRQLIYQLPANILQEGLEPDSYVLTKDNILWIAISGAGLIGLDADNFTERFYFDNKNILPTNDIFSLQLSGGDLWFASSMGLFRMDIASHHVEMYTVADGLNSNEFEGASYAHLFDDQLMFGSVKGITWFSPAAIKQQSKVDLKVRISDFSLLSRQLTMPIQDLNNHRIELAYDDIGLKINYSTLNYSSQHKIRYQYWLQGDSTISYPETAENSVLFPQLKPGHYHFNVRAIAPESGKKGQVSSLLINISYAPWSSPLAYSIYVFCVLTLIFMWLRYKRQQQQQLFEGKERLQLALEGSRSGVWDWHTSSNIIYQNREFQSLANTTHHQCLLQEHVEQIHPNEQTKYLLAWELFIQGKTTSFQCDYRLLMSDESYQWYRDLGRVVAKSGKLPLRVTGTFTNINATRDNEEKIKVFGEAFREIRDWVAILDAKQNPIALNNSFCEAMALSEHELLEKGFYVQGFSTKKRRHYFEILTAMVAGQHWQGEELVVNGQGVELPVWINISAVANSNNNVAFFVVVLTDISEQKEAETELRYLANFDQLTGLPNRTLALDRIKHAIVHANRDKKKIALFFLDLDKFKQINDSLGHDLGDLLLQKVSKRLQRTLREDDTVARLGGDEFIVLLESFPSVDDLGKIAKKMIRCIDKPMILEGHRVSISSSIGIAVCPDDANTSAELIKHADIAMYHAKEQGRGNFQFFIQAMNVKAKLRLSQENKIKQACQNNEFINYYQAIIDGQTGRLAGVELLMRWQTTEGIVAPSEFIDIAEDLGLIIAMTRSAIHRGFADLSYWRNELAQDIYLSINLSVSHLQQDNLAEDIAAMLKQHHIDASTVRFEITESAFMKDQAKALNTMNELVALGLQLALDDFGTGYSSLGYLKKFPINIIKIDRSFVMDIGINSQNEALIDAILLMAKSLHMYCIAEGVETAQQVDYLLQRQCYLLQGYKFSKPVAAKDIPPLLKKVFILGET